jgi:methylthioribose-1-phosphate isomerase
MLDSKYLTIEERHPDEVRKQRPKNLNIWNPAVDTISNKVINGFITEKGIMRRVT